MLRSFPRSLPWEDWLARTGALPPDFDTLPRVPGLPDPLAFADGRRVRSRADWRDRRQELLRLFAVYVTGTVPPPPGNVRAAERVAAAEAGARVERITLEFGPEHRARLHLEIIAPHGAGPFPVFLTQDNHRPWALVAVSRGYLGAVYAGADSKDDTGAWTAVWPEHDWTKLTRRAWAASRCIDYLLTRPDVDRARIALTGHSRNGKASLIAAALDERIAAVISSSSGAGGACTYRFFSETQFGEGIELITRTFPDWLHPRLRFFAGREAYLPIDQHELLACIAPRPCLIATALNDNVESVWAVEQTCAAARPVYAHLGAPDALALRYRDGVHTARAGDIEGYVDWLDQRFGRAPARGRRAAASATSPPIYPTYADWLRHSGERIRPEAFPARHNPPPDLAADPARRRETLERVGWVLGERPPTATTTGGSYGAEPAAVAALLNRASPPSGVAKQSLGFGPSLTGDLYTPAGVAGTDRRLPALVWVHPISVSNGYVPGYFRGDAPHAMLARSGYAVFAFDQIGNGSRILEVRDFYRRHPHWSILGKTVEDLRAAVDALVAHPRIDPAQIFLLGYATGGMAALHAAALDERVAGVIAVGAFTPLRSDTPDKRTGGVARWAQWLPFLPRLGAFVGHEERIPYDYDELLALIAPRTVLVIAPGIDPGATFVDIKACVDRARPVFAAHGRPESLVLQRTDDYHHFSPDLIWCLCGVETVH
jgi:cephalosporin-C deacetylase-like acetyl esterase